MGYRGWSIEPVLAQRRQRANQCDFRGPRSFPVNRQFSATESTPKDHVNEDGFASKETDELQFTSF